MNSCNHKNSIKNSYDLGYTILGPLVHYFCEQIKLKCYDLGINKIFFLSRDGQTPFICFNIHHSKKSWNFSTKYLYVSRQTLHLPSITHLDEYTYSWLFDDTNLNIHKVLNRLNISEKEVSIPDNLKMEITSENLTQLKNWLCSPKMTSLILYKSEQSRKKLIQYLRQEGFFTENKIALVDIGWHGRLQTSLTKVTRMENPEMEIHGFYLGLFQYPKQINKEFLHPILFSPNTPRNRFKRNAEVYEILMSATHETTITYTADENGKINPALLKEIDEDQKKIIENIQNGSAQYCIKSIDKTTTLDEAIYVMSNLFSFPSSTAIKAIKSILFSSSQGASSNQSLLQNFSKKEILLSLVGKKAISRTIWLEAEIVNAFPPAISWALLWHLYLSRKIHQLTSP